MRYEDASQTGAISSDVTARDDADHLAANNFGPATGNAITGTGTITGATGTDTAGQIIAIQGAGGSDTTFENGQLEIAGQYGVLSIDADGNYSYVRNPGTPDGVSDVFIYTLANAGATDNAKLTINIGDLPILQAQGTRVVPGPDGVVVLPAGVELSDVRVVGRDLVITLPDGSTMTIVDGAVFVPQLVLGGVEVPASNLAALLIDAEPRPAAGDLAAVQQSSGGNFAVPVQPLDPGVPLGDLLPPTELFFTPPDFEEIQFLDEDDPPFIGDSAVNVSEEGVSSINLPNPDTSGSPDTTNSPTNGGIIPISDPNDDPLTVAMGAPTASLTSQGVAITWAVSNGGHTLTGSAGANTVITINIDDTGAYTVTLLRPIDHPTGGGEQGASFVIPVSVSDGENTTGGGTITVTIEDDSPTIAGQFAEPTLVVDETLLGANDTRSFAGAFDVDFGADGAAASGSIAYALGINAGASGLVDTATGAAVVLSLESGAVVGRAGAGGPVVFTVTVDGSGNVTLDQQRAVVHNDPADHDEPGASAATLAADNLVTLSLVATDRDGDTASTTVNIGLNLQFEDDGPSITNLGAQPTLTVDETVLATNASASFAGAFAATFGADGPAVSGSITYALGVSSSGVDSGLNDSLTGQDIFLFLNGSVVEGRVGGVGGAVAFTVSVDAAGVVTLDQLRAVVHDDPSDPDEASSPAVLSGDNLITLTATATDGDGDSASASIGIGSNLAFEDDGPTIDVSVIAGVAEPVLLTQDTQTDGTPTTQDSASSSANFGGVFSLAFTTGADGAPTPTLSYALGVTSSVSGLTQSGTAINLYLIGGVVVGSTSATQAGVNAGNTVFDVTVSATGVVTLTQYSQIDHPLGGDPSPSGTLFEDHVVSLADGLVTLTASSTITDNDGDSATDSATVNIGANLQFADDGPDISAVLTGTQIRIDETDGVVAAGGEVDPVGGNLGTVTVSAATLFTVSQPNVSADTPTTLGYSLVLSAQGVASGLLQSAANEPIFLYNIGGTIHGSTSATLAGVNAGNTAFTVSIDSGTGAVTLTQFLAVEHFNTSSHDEDSSGLTAGVLQVQVTATDFDGDTDQASVDLGSAIRFEDDGPTIDVSVDGQVPEPVLLTQDTQTDGTPTTQDSASSSANFGGVFNLAFTTGSDGAPTPVLTYVLGVSAPGVDSGLDQSGASIFLYNIGGVVVGSTSATQAGVNAGNTVFDVTVNASGVVTLTQYSQIDHPLAGDPSPSGTPFEDHIVSLADALVTLTASSTITDNDGDTATDSATVNIGANLQFADDGPDVAATLTGTLLKLDETDGVGVPGEVDPVGGNLGTITVNAATLVTITQPNVSADTPTTLAYTLVLSSDGVNSGLLVSSNNAPIFLYNIGGTIHGSTSATLAGVNAGNTAFTVSINSGTGAVTMTQFLAVEHPTPGASHDEDSSAIAAGALNLVVTATDFDGDTDTASVDLGSVIRFEDDGPSAQNDVDVIIGGNGPATGNVMTGVEVAVAEDANATDGVADNVGSDTPGSITFIDHSNAAPGVAVPAGGSVNILGDHGTLTIYANGDYSYLRTSAAGGVQDVFTYTLTDADGDTTTATLTISIEDNFPSLADPDLVRLDDDVIPGAGGNVDGPGDDDPDAVPGNVVNGQLNGVGGDAPLTYNFTGTNTLPSGFSIGAGSDADTLLINQGSTLVMTIQLNQSTGAFTVTQNAPILHPADNGGPEDNIENNLLFSIGVEVEDSDGDVEPATITINVDDDTPTIDVTKGADAAVVLTTDDPQTIGSDSDTASTSANFSGVFGLTQSAGADGAASAATLSFALGVSAPGVDSGLDQGGASIFLYNIGGVVVGSTSATQAGVTAGNTVFDVSVSATGVVTLTQYSQIDHPVGSDPTPGGSPFADHIVSMADALITLTASSSLTDNDGDTVTDSEVVNIGANLRFTDDGPDVASVLTGTLLKLDETDGVGVPGEVDPVGGNLGTITVAAATLFTVTQPHVSADSPTTLGYALTLSSQGVDSGLDVSSNNASIFLYNIGGTIHGSTSATLAGVTAGNTAFTVSVNSGTGAVTMTQFLAIEHPTPGASHDEDSSAIAAGALNLVVTATDFDGDTDTASVDLGSVIRFEDDGPTITSVTDPLNIDNDATPSGLGNFVFDVGSDENADFNDISVSGFTVSVNGVPLDPSDFTLTAGVEDANAANYTFSFDYDTGAGGTQTATGTLVFHKTGPNAGKYEVTLTSGPIQGVTLVQTSDPSTTFVEYDLDGGAPDVVTAQLASNLFAQFTAESTNNNSTPNLLTTGGNDTAWNAGELFTADPGNPQVSNTDAGVDGNTMDTGEVLDFDLFTTDPGSNTALTPTASATEMFIQFFQFTANDDIIVILKLQDADNPAITTTRAILVDGDDVFLQGDTATGSAYAGLVAALGSQDALLVIQSNDYNAAGENWVIVGAQIVTDNDGTSGTGIDLDGELGASGASDRDGDGDFGTDSANPALDELDTFADDTDVSGLKITSIGFLTEATEDQDATLEFDVTITDADGDTVTQTDVTVQIGTPSSPASLPLTTKDHGPDVQDGLSTTASLLTTETADLQRVAANSNTTVFAAALAAAGMAASSAAAAPSTWDAEMQFSGITNAFAGRDSFSDLGGDYGVGTFSALAGPADGGFDFATQAMSSSSFNAIAASHIGELAAEVSLGSAPTALLQGTEMAVSKAIPAPVMDVAMPSAEALMAAGLTGNVQTTGAVEQIVADALNGGGQAVDIDAMLNALPAQGLGENPALDALATPVGGNVPTWDMGQGAGFTFDAATLITSEAMVLHHDAIQPVANG